MVDLFFWHFAGYIQVKNKILENSRWTGTCHWMLLLAFLSTLAIIPVGAQLSPKVQLRSGDGEMFEVDEAVALQSQTVKNMIGSEAPIPLPNVPSNILAKVIEYSKYHVDARMSAGDESKAVPTEEEIKAWDAEFVKVDQATLFDLILAANYLNVKNLLDLTCQTLEDMIKGKSPEEIRKMFNIKNDFTPQ